MSRLKIIQNGKDLIIEKNEIPAQFSADISVEFVKDKNFSDYIVIPSVKYGTTVSPLVFENGFFKLPKQAFKKKGMIYIAFLLINGSEGFNTNKIEIYIEDSVGGNDILPSKEEIWTVEVINAVDQYMDIKYIKILDDLIKSNTKLNTDTLELQRLINEVVDILNKKLENNEFVPKHKFDSGKLYFSNPDGSWDSGYALAGQTSITLDDVVQENMELRNDLSDDNSLVTALGIRNHLYRPSLTINGDFQINQRGKLLYEITPSHTTYTVDMWWVWQTQSGGKVEILPNGNIKTTNVHSLNQFLEDLMKVGKKYIAVLKINNLIKIMDIIGGTNKDGTSQNIPIIYTAERNKLSIMTSLNGTDEIEYMDLFKGDIVYSHVKEYYTLALLRCSPYYQVLKNVNLRMCIRNGAAHYYWFSLDNEMSKNCTATISSDSYICTVQTEPFYEAPLTKYVINCDYGKRVLIKKETTSAVDSVFIGTIILDASPL